MTETDPTTHADLDALLGTLDPDEDLMYDHPVSMVGPMNPVLFVRWDALVAALREWVARETALEAAAQRLADACGDRAAAGNTFLDIMSDVDMEYLDALKALRALLAEPAPKGVSR